MWGYSSAQIRELDYGEDLLLDDKVRVIFTPARHFSGRFLKENPTEPGSFVLITDRFRFFYSGDSGYGEHFRQIGEKYGPFDLAVMEDGQYDMQWHNVHMLPQEVLKAAEDLGVKAVLPVHNSKFVLANHAWKEPLLQLEKLSDGFVGKIVTPLIGEVIYLDDLPEFNPWWHEID